MKYGPGSSMAALLHRSRAQQDNSSRNKRLGNDTVHIHGMWFHPNSKDRLQAQDRESMDRLRTAHTTVTNATRNIPSNFNAHLWTDRKSMRALYMPVIRSGQPELEIPHAMISNSHVSIHLAGEIESLISRFDGPHKRTLEELFNHPANINIGFRSDIFRLLYTILYSEKANESGIHEADEFNIHLDIDAMRVAEEHKKEQDTGHSSFGGKASQPVHIPDQLHRSGYGTLSKGDNDVLGASPRHFNAIGVAEATLALLKEGTWESFAVFFDDPSSALNSGIGTTFRKHDLEIKHYAGELHALNRKSDDLPQKILSQEDILDYFRLAEKIRQSKPTLQTKVDELADVIENNKNQKEVAAARMELKAINNVYDTCGKFIEAYVNKHSYLPQVTHTPRYNSPEFNQMAGGFKHLLEPMFGDYEFGAFRTFQDSDKSWRAGILSFNRGKLNVTDNDVADFEERAKAFRGIRNMIKASTTDELDFV